MRYEDIYKKAISLKPISKEEAIFLFNNTSVTNILALANEIRYILNPNKRVSWQIDRNINYTNVCISGCLFCNFHCKVSEKDRSWVLELDDYKKKIDELFELGGDQILLQGGLHPKFDISYFETLFKALKTINPKLKLNALGPAEVAHIARISGLTIEDTLKRLISAGLDSLPGAGAEILKDKIRKIISPAKPNSESWLNVMKVAHSLGLGSTSTMVYGHIESTEDIIDHLIQLRDLQEHKPKGNPGFRAFIAWPMQMEGTKLGKLYDIKILTPVEHLKIIAISRIVLNNIQHIQASWLTIGMELAKLALHSGADDMGSIMIEENVVSSAGARFTTDKDQIQKVIIEAGFEPWRRNQDYTPHLEED